MEGTGATDKTIKRAVAKTGFIRSLCFIHPTATCQQIKKILDFLFEKVYSIFRLKQNKGFYPPERYFRYGKKLSNSGVTR
jgi:hypothetical protein